MLSTSVVVFGGRMEETRPYSRVDGSASISPSFINCHKPHTELPRCGIRMAYQKPYHSVGPTLGAAFVVKQPIFTLDPRGCLSSLRNRGQNMNDTTPHVVSGPHNNPALQGWRYSS